MKRTQASAGFTLIELILAMTILASMMVLVGVSISRASKAKVKIQKEVEAASGLRDAMRVIREDLNLAYNHYDFELDINEQAKKPTQQIGPGGVPLQPPATQNQTTQSQRKSPATKFVGEENSLNFVTMNNGRMTANDVQADFIEVGYFLKNCTSYLGDAGRADNNKKSQGSNCLFRRTQKIIDNDVTKGGVEMMLLEDVTEFSLKYLVEGKLDWVKEYKTEKARYNIFPDAVEVTLGIEKEFEGKQKKYSIQYVVPIHFPNNIKPSGGSSTGTQSPGTTSVDGMPTQ